MKRSILFSCLIILLCANCQDEADCISITTDFVNLSFYDLDENEADTITMNNLSIIGSDSILLNDTTISTIQIPLNPNATSTTFAFDTEFGLDTLALSYVVSTRLVSEDCGLEVLFSGLTTLRSDFDSLTIINDILVEEIDEDVRIFN